MDVYVVEPAERQLPAPAGALLFRDPRSLQLLQQVARVARSDASALVIGETGTGKELVARHLHELSGRRGPFVAVNCGAFSESLADAELFGHEAGAYTGAGAARAGWFEAAQGGTLFLDEIGDLPLPLQVKLLRVLQERQVVRLGSRRPVSLDVRLVAATNVDLAQAVAAQRFRADLFYRLSVAALSLPALRERPGDILPLAEHFLRRHAASLGLTAPALAEDARAALLAHRWPGNIRELDNAIHFALIQSPDGVVRAAHLQLVDRLRPSSPVTLAAAVPASVSALPPVAEGDPLHERLDAVVRDLLAARPDRLLRDVEAALVRAAFQLAGDNQVRAARLLGVTRNTVRTLLRRHGAAAPAATSAR